MSLETKDVVNGIKKQPVASACGFVFFVLLIALYFRFGALAEAEAVLEQRTKTFRELKNNVSYSAQLDDHVKQLSAANQRIDASALRAAALAQNQQIFYLLEAQTGVKIVDIRQQAVPPPAKGAPATGYIPIDFSLNVEGGYEQVLLFMKRVERSPSINRLAGATMSVKETGVATVSMNVAMLGIR